MKEEFRDIPGYEGIYQASNLGRIYSMPRKWGRPNGLYLKPSTTTHGYNAVVLYKDKSMKTFKLHRLVIASFKGESKLHVNHIDGNKNNNDLNNLEYVTLSENTQHAYATGLMNPAKGTRHHNTTLSEDQVRRIKFVSKYINTEVGYWAKVRKSLNVTPSTMYGILHNKTWKHIEV